MRGAAGRMPVQARGFTLIEIMVVVAIIAVLSSMLVIVAVPNESALAEMEARRLASLLELAVAEARASGKSIAWSPEDGRYSFWQMSDDGQWTRFPDSSIYRQRTFSGQIEFRQVLVDARELAPGDRIILSPYGAHGLIEATIGGGNAQFILRGNVLGRISLQRVSDSTTDANPPSAALQRLYLS